MEDTFRDKTSKPSNQSNDRRDYWEDIALNTFTPQLVGKGNISVRTTLTKVFEETDKMVKIDESLIEIFESTNH